MQFPVAKLSFAIAFKCRGDGASIEAAVLDEIREAYQEEAVLFHWREGDILMLDNMLIVHGHAPFVGPRNVLGRV